MKSRPGRWQSLFFACVAALVSAAPAWAEVPGRSVTEEVVTDFDTVPADLQAIGLIATIDTAKPAAGKGAMKLVPGGNAGDRKPAVSFPTPAWDASTIGWVRISLRATADVPSLSVRITGLDAEGRRIVQRRYNIRTNEDWMADSASLLYWRWGDATAGPWSEVRRLLIEPDPRASAVWVDDLQIGRLRAKEPGLGRDLLSTRAFENSRWAEADDILIGTDALDGITEADLQRILGNARKCRAMIGRVFGDAVRPLDGPTPPALLIFATPEKYQEFWMEMGRTWNATITPPKSGGYTIQDIATSTYSARLGPYRPVYLHELTHALLAHDVRLMTGNDRHWPLHEGLAAYVQLCVYPTALEPRAYPAAFAQYAADRTGLFIPLEQLLTKRGAERNYAQLASVIAFLTGEKPKWLPLIARTLADGGSMDDALKQCATTWADFEKAWLDWGTARFRARRDDGHFEAPEEWKAKTP